MMQEAEKDHVKKLVRRLLDEGYTISVDDGDDGYLIKKSSDYDAIVAELFSMDEDRLHVHKDYRDRVVWCIYGNSPEEVVADYSGSLDPIVQAVYREMFPDALSSG